MKEKEEGVMERYAEWRIRIFVSIACVFLRDEFFLDLIFQEKFSTMVV